MDLSVNARKQRRLWYLSLLVPMLLSFLAARHPTVWYLLLFSLSHFLILWLTPLYRSAENIGMFVMLSVTVQPINFRIALESSFYLDPFEQGILLGILRSIIGLAILFSVEQLIMGFLTRLFWPRQRGLRLK